MRKERLKQILDEFPDEVDIDAFLYRIELFDKIETAEKQIVEGDVYTHEDVKRQLKTWLE